MIHVLNRWLRSVSTHLESDSVHSRSALVAESNSNDSTEPMKATGKRTTTLPRLVNHLVVCILATALLQGCSDNGSTSSGSLNPDGFQVLLSSTFKHPRCVNCHGFEENSIGRSHRQQGRSEDCLICHRVSEWRAPISSFSFTNVSSEEICRAIKNKFSGDLDALGNHMVSSPLNRWGVEQGNVPNGTTLPTAPPNSIATLKATYDRWVIKGAVCD